MGQKAHTTRTYRQAGATVAMTGTASAATALPSGSDVEIRIVLTSNGFIEFGASDVAATADANAIPVAAWSPEVIQIPAGSTHFSVIKASGAPDGAAYVHRVI